MTRYNLQYDTMRFEVHRCDLVRSEVAPRHTMILVHNLASQRIARTPRILLRRLRFMLNRRSGLQSTAKIYPYTPII